MTHARIHSRLASTFNGSTQRVSMGNVLAFERTDAFSVWCWFKTSSVATQDLVGKIEDTGGTGRGYVLLIDGAITVGAIGVMLRNTSGNRILVLSNATFNDGKWHFVAFTYSGSSAASGVKIYVDGVQVATTTQEDTLSATILSTSNFTVGSRNNTTTSLFTGTLDEPGIAAKELSAAEVRELWNGGRPPDVRDVSFYTPSVRFSGDAWRAGDGDAAATWTSVPGRNNGTTTSFTTANYVNDVPFRTHLNVLSLLFDGTDDHVSLGDVLEFERTDTFSFEFWFRSNTAAAQSIIAKLDVAGSGTGYEVSLNSSGSILLSLVNTSTTDELIVRTTATGFADNAWHHVVVTYDGTSAPSGVVIWVDGSNQGLTTISNTLTATIVNNIALRFGARSDGTQRYTGRLCQMAFYNAELSSGSVSALYSQGPVNKAVLSSWQNCVGWWPLGGCDTGPGALATAVDRVSAYTPHNGTTSGSPVVDVSVPSGGLNRFADIAIALDGTAHYIDCADVASFQFERTDDFSLECWFKAQASVTGTDTIVAKSDGTTPFQGYRVSIDSSEFIHFILANNTTDLIDVRTTDAINDGNWHHLVVTYDGTSTAAGTKIYIDGVLRPMTTVSNTLSASILHAVSLQWGAQEATNFFHGSLAGCAVWDKALTVAEVGEQYQGRPINKAATSITANLVGWWPLGCGEIDPTNSTKVCDYSDNSLNHGTLTGSGSGFGQFTTDAPTNDPSGYLGPEATSGRSVAQAQGSYTVLAVPEFVIPSTEPSSFRRDAGSEATSGRGIFQAQGLYDARFLPEYAIPPTESTIELPPGDASGRPEGIPGGGGGGSVTTYFRMRGVDNGTSAYTTWTVTTNPDPDGNLATGANTTPPLVGTIVAGSGIVISTWQA